MTHLLILHLVVNWEVFTINISNSNCDDLGCMSLSFIDCKLFSILTRASRGSSSIAELLVRTVYEA